MTFITTGPSQPGILLDTPPTPERRIADLEERLRQVIGEREQAYAKVANALESAKVRGEALERTEAEVDRLRTVVGDLVDERKKAEAELAEITQRQGATHHHWTEIAAMPQVWVSDRLGGTCHESIMRSFHVAEETRRLLEMGTPPAVVLQVMDLLEGRRRT